MVGRGDNERAPAAADAPCSGASPGGKERIRMPREVSPRGLLRAGFYAPGGTYPLKQS